ATSTRRRSWGPGCASLASRRTGRAGTRSAARGPLRRVRFPLLEEERDARHVAEHGHAQPVEERAAPAMVGGTRWAPQNPGQLACVELPCVAVRGTEMMALGQLQELAVGPVVGEVHHVVRVPL